MSLIKLVTQPSRRDLLIFGLSLPLFTVVLGLVLHYGWKLPTAAIVAWIAGAVASVLFAVAPPLRRPIYLALVFATWPIGWVISHLVLAVVFYLVLTPIGLVMRMCGYDPLGLKLDRQAKSYWIARPQQSDSSRYFQQF